MPQRFYFQNLSFLAEVAFNFCFDFVQFLGLLGNQPFPRLANLSHFTVLFPIIDPQKLKEDCISLNAMGAKPEILSMHIRL